MHINALMSGNKELIVEESKAAEWALGGIQECRIACINKWLGVQLLVASE